MSHLIKEINEEYKFNKITCPEGHYITNWDKVDYLTYTASTVMFTPLEYSLDGYYCVTEAEHTELMNKHREAVEKLDREQNNNPVSGSTME